MKCFDCIHASGRRAEKMARLGFLACDQRPAGHLVSAEYKRNCPDYKPASAEQMRVRNQWREKVK